MREQGQGHTARTVGYGFTCVIPPWSHAEVQVPGARGGVSGGRCCTRSPGCCHPLLTVHQARAYPSGWA